MVSYQIMIRHRAGACGGTVCVYGLCSSLDTPSSILQAPGLGVGAGSSSLEAGVWSLQPHPGGFLLGRARGFARGSSRGLLPPWRNPWRLSSPILPRLGAPVRHLGTKMPQHLPRYPKKHHLGANIFQHSSQNPPKTASRTLQRRPQPPKSHQKCCSVVRFYTSAIFPKIAKK